MRAPPRRCRRHRRWRVRADDLSLDQRGRDEREATARRGDFTLHGATRPLTLDISFNGGYAGHPMDPNARIGFSDRGKLKRSDFGVSFGIPEPGSQMGVGDDVEAGFPSYAASARWPMPPFLSAALRCAGAASARTHPRSDSWQRTLATARAKARFPTARR